MVANTSLCSSIGCCSTHRRPGSPVELRCRVYPCILDATIHSIEFDEPVVSPFVRTAERLMTVLASWLTDGPLITDGAWGTELQARGLPTGTNPDTWNLTHPERVEEVARAYAEAGSQIILTNTFRANLVAMKENAADLDAINRAGVALSRRGAPAARVFASIGPTGKILMSGEVSSQEVSSAFAAQAHSLAAAGADALLIETMSDIEEARLAVAAALPTGLPVIASFAFDSGKNKDRTMMGATPEAVAAAMEEAGAHFRGCQLRRRRGARHRPLPAPSCRNVPSRVDQAQCRPAHHRQRRPALHYFGCILRFALPCFARRRRLFYWRMLRLDARLHSRPRPSPGCDARLMPPA